MRDDYRQSNEIQGLRQELDALRAEHEAMCRRANTGEYCCAAHGRQGCHHG